MIGNTNTRYHEFNMGGGVIELGYFDSYWTIVSDKQIQIIFTDIDGEYIDSTNPFLVDNKINNGLSIQKNSNISLNKILDSFIYDKVWKIGISMNNTRYGYSGCGNFFDCIAIGGNNIDKNSEIFNGISWRASSITQPININYGDSIIGLNSSNMLLHCGYDLFKFNSSEWNFIGMSNTSRYYHTRSSVGNTNSFIMNGGDFYTIDVEEYNGDVFKISPSTNILKCSNFSIGNINSILSNSGGEPNWDDPSCEYYNGNTWSIIEKEPVFYNIWCDGIGNINNAIVNGGYGYTTKAAYYNGNTWIINKNEMNINRANHLDFGKNSIFAVGGFDGNSNYHNSTETLNFIDDNDIIIKLYIPN